MGLDINKIITESIQSVLDESSTKVIEEEVVTDPAQDKNPEGFISSVGKKAGEKAEEFKKIAIDSAKSAKSKVDEYTGGNSKIAAIAGAGLAAGLGAVALRKKLAKMKK